MSRSATPLPYPGLAAPDGTALPALEGPPLDAAVSLRAVEWWVALQGPEAGAATHEACRRWRAAHDDHERAWRHVEACAVPLRGLPAPLARGTLLTPPQARRGGRRRTLQLLGVLAMSGGGALALHEGRWQQVLADHHTAIGERREWTLPDGTHLVLNTDSAVRLRFDADERRLQLLRGEILVTTAPDAGAPAGLPGRPFVVETREGRLRPLGTRFSVRRHAHEDESELAVFEGQVEVRPAAAPGAGRVLRAGEGVRFDRGGVADTRPVPAHAAAWTRGMFVARDLPLDAFVAELARYRHGHLACDPDAAALRISGVYPMADSDRVLDMLRRTQPIETLSLTRWWVVVRGRRS